MEMGVGFNIGMNICGAGVFLCLGSYMMSKIFIYLFMVERVRLVHSTRTPRLRDKLYLFNSLGMLLPFTVIGLLNFVYRISFIDEQGVCHLGMERKSLVPLLIFDSLANIYLTILFILPLTKLHSFNKGNLSQPSAKLRSLTIRTVVGCLLTLLSTAANATSLAIAEGQPATICMMTCCSDVLFCVLVLHFITKGENDDGKTDTTVAMNNRTPSRMETGANITITRSYQVDHSQKAPNDTKDDVKDTVVLVDPHRYYESPGFESPPRA